MSKSSTEDGIALIARQHPGLPEDFDYDSTEEIDSGEFSPEALEEIEITIKGENE